MGFLIQLDNIFIYCSTKTYYTKLYGTLANYFWNNVNYNWGDFQSSRKIQFAWRFQISTGKFYFLFSHSNKHCVKYYLKFNIKLFLASVSQIKISRFVRFLLLMTAVAIAAAGSSAPTTSFCSAAAPGNSCSLIEFW